MTGRGPHLTKALYSGQAWPVYDRSPSGACSPSVTDFTGSEAITTLCQGIFASTSLCYSLPGQHAQGVSALPAFEKVQAKYEEIIL